MVSTAQVVDVLTFARALQEAGRCQGPWATRPARGGVKKCKTLDPKATCYCAYAALHRAIYELDLHDYHDGPPELHLVRGLPVMERAVQLLARALRARLPHYRGTVSMYNDDLATDEEMLSLYDAAVALTNK